MAYGELTMVSRFVIVVDFHGRTRLKQFVQNPELFFAEKLFTRYFTEHTGYSTDKCTMRSYRTGLGVAEYSCL